MRSVAPEFAPPKRATAWPWWAASAVLLAFAGYESFEVLRLRDELKRLQAEEAASAAAAVPPAPAASKPPYYEDALRWAQIASMDVAGVFASIESARVPSVRVSAIEVRTDEGQAKLEVELQDLADLLRYVEDINVGVPVSERWSLIRAQAPGTNSPGSAMLTKPLKPRDATLQR